MKEEVLKLLAVEKERSKVMEEERKERQENRKTTIDPNCPKYSGRFDENVEVWIFRVTHAMAMQKVPTKEQLSALRQIYVLTCKPLAAHWKGFSKKYKTQVKTNGRRLRL